MTLTMDVDIVLRMLLAVASIALATAMIAYNQGVGPRAIKNRRGREIGYGGCYRCGDTWDWKKPMESLWFNNHGIFPCCEECWPELTPDQKLEYCVKLFEHWRSFDSQTGETTDVGYLTEQARRAIERELRNE